MEALKEIEIKEEKLISTKSETIIDNSDIRASSSSSSLLLSAAQSTSATPPISTIKTPLLTPGIVKIQPPAACVKISAPIIKPTFPSRPRSVTASLFAIASSKSATVATPSTSVDPIPSLSQVSPSISNNSVIKSQQRGISVTAKVFGGLNSTQQTQVYQPTQQQPLQRPQPVTSKLFVPRTEDMNKGFLMYSDEEPGLISK